MAGLMDRKVISPEPEAGHPHLKRTPIWNIIGRFCYGVWRIIGTRGKTA